MDEYICPVDGKNIVDDDLKALLSKKLPKGVRYKLSKVGASDC